MKLALFADTIDITNGYGNITYEFCSALEKSGTDFALFLPETEKRLIDSMHLAWDVRPLLPPPVFRLYQKAGWKYWKTLDVSDCTIVHAIFGYPYGMIAMRSAKRAGVPFLMGAQGTYGVLPLTQYPERWFLKRSYDKAVAITVPSVFTADLIEKTAGKKYPGVRIIHNGVRYARFSTPVDTSALRKKYAGKTMLLTVGGLKARKGQDLVIRALPEIKKTHPETLYVIVGTGKSQAGLMELARSLGVLEMVEFAGSKTGDDLVAYFQSCDIYVHTPKVVNLQFEGFGIVYLEAGAAGKPSVATDAGGIRDAVIDGETGLVVPDGDVEAIARSIIRFISDEGLRKHLGEGGQAYAEKHDWSHIASQYVSLYREMHG